MSFRKLDQTFPKNNLKITDKKLSKTISEILKNKAGRKHGAIKYLSNLTGIETHTLKKWYNGSGLPDLANFITLAYYIPEIIQIFLELCNRSEIWNACREKTNTPELINNLPKTLKNDKFYTDIFDGIKSDHLKILNQRQLWFLENIASGNNIKKTDIVKYWQVSGRTAERDIIALVKSGKIKFVGSKKYGKYSLI
jgi:hypothetical protein